MKLRTKFALATAFIVWLCWGLSQAAPAPGKENAAKAKEGGLAKIKDAQKQINKGEDFGEVAKKFSQDGAAQKGGVE